MKTNLSPIKWPLLVCGFMVCTALSAQRNTPEQYIDQWKDVAVRKMQEHGIPASITLAQGLLESGNGNSVLATKGNNHFGIKCTSDWTGGKTYHDDDRKNECFRKYRDAAESYNDHALFLKRPRYASLFTLEPTDYKGWAYGLKKAGYATDPNYPKKLISLIERYALHQLDRGVPIATKSPDHGVRKPGKLRKPDGDVIVIGAGRQIEQFEGRIKFVRANAGDDFRKLAHDLEMTHGLLARWNDMDKNATLQEGQIIFIQPKRRASKSAKIHLVQAGEDLWSISQLYGVKLKKLEKYNPQFSGKALPEGERIHLRKPKG